MVRINIDINDHDLTQYYSRRDPAQKKGFILDKLVEIFDEHCMRRDRDRRIDEALAVARTEEAARGIDAESMTNLKRYIVAQGYTPKDAIIIEQYIRNRTELDYTALLNTLREGSLIHILTSFRSKEDLIAMANSVQRGTAGGRGGGKKGKTRRRPKKKRTRR